MSQPNEHVAAETPGPGRHVADLADDFVHRLLDADRAAEVERHCAACPACQAAVDDARRRLAALKAEPPVEASEELVRKTIGKIQTHQKSRKRRFRIFLAAAGGLLAASVAVLTWLHIYYYNYAATPYDMVVLGQRDLMAAANGSLRVVLRDHATLAPIAHVAGTVKLVGGGQSVDLASFTTDADGVGEPRFTLPDWPDGGCTLRVEARTAGAPEVREEPVTLRRSFQLMLTSDKPVYQPGQIIHVRALALRRPDLHPVADQSAVFSVVNPKGDIVFKQEDKTSKYGIAATDCPLDSEIQEGPYTVLCKTGEVESRLSVDVRKYVLPKFKVTVAPDRPYYRPGDTIKVAVQANYFFGKASAGSDNRLGNPVADAEVSVAVTDDAGGPPEKRAGRTDDKGAVTIDYTPRLAVHYRFQATVVDAAGQKQTASADVPVSASPARIEVLPEAGELVQGLTNTVYVLVTRVDGKPAGKARVTLASLDGIQNHHKLVPDQTAVADEGGAASFSLVPANLYTTPSGWQAQLEVAAFDDWGAELARRNVVVPCGPAGDFLVRTDKAVYRGGETMTLTALGGGADAVYVDLLKDGQTLRTETIDIASGSGQAQVDLSPELSGTLQVVAYRLNRDGRPERKERLVYVRPADEVHIDATLDPGKTEYRPGDTPKLRVKLTGKDGKPCPGAVSLCGVDEAVFSVLPQRPGLEEAYYTLQEDLMAPVRKIHPWSPDDGGSAQFEEALFAAASRADPVFPNHDGPPIPGGVMAGPMPGGPAVPPGFVKGVPSRFVPPEQLSVQPAGETHSLDVQTYPEKAAHAEQARQDGLGVMKWLWMAFAGAAVAAALFGFCLFGQTGALVKALVTGSIAVPLVLFGLAAFIFRDAITSDRMSFAAGKAAPVFTVLDESGAMAEDRVAAGEAVPAKAPPPRDDATNMGAKQPGGGAPEPRIRQLFPETMLWKPDLITDDKGEAALPLELPDSITTWRLSASAVTGDGRLGAAQLPVPVNRDFFVDLNLPVALTRGDEVGVPVVVYNYLDKPQTVTLTLADDADGWCKRLDGAEQRVEVGPHTERSVTYRLKAEKVGNWTLTVKAAGAADSDAVKRSVEVLPDGRRVEEMVNGTLEKPADVTLTLPADCIPGSQREVVKIYPSTFSQVVEGLDNIFRMPSGCFEQTSSTTYPNVLALDYMKRTGKDDSALRMKAEGYIRSGYQRLLGFEVQGGGFEWFGRAPASRTLTAYGLMEFADMARVSEVDPNMVARTRNWLLAQRRPDGSWDPDQNPMLHEDMAGARTAEDARLAETAYVAWAVVGDPAAAGQSASTFTYLKSGPAAGISDAHTLALVCNALLAVDEHNADAAPYLDRLEAMKKFDDAGKFAWWEQPAGARTTFYGAGRSGQIETTALAALALLRSGRNPDATRKALAWLTAQKDPAGTWYSTQATVLALKALLAGTGKPLAGQAERVVELRLDGELVESLRLPADQADVLKQIDLSARLKPGKQVLTVTEANGTAVGFQSSFRCNVPDAGARPQPLAVALTYDRTTLSVGEHVAATATVRLTDPKASAPMVMVELPIPPGFTASADDFAPVAKYQIGPRSILLYLNGLEAGRPLTVTYHLKATMPVKASAPGARAYEYYDPDKQGSSPPTRFTVTAAE